jgi:hypothetical protein
LGSPAVLAKASISLKKRIVGVVKGLKQKPASTDNLEVGGPRTLSVHDTFGRDNSSLNCA